MSNTNKRRESPLFDPASDKPFRVSRTKIDLFLRCPFCFYVNQRHGAKVPGGPPFGLNIRIDTLLKKDADVLRSQQKINPRTQKFGVNAIPFNHPNIKQWLDVFNNVGLEYLHTPTNLIIFGAPDDIWLVDNVNLSVVDIKATHSNKPIEESYFWEENKRQVELYSWLLTQQGLTYPVSNKSYFVRINTDKEQDSFDDNCLKFKDEVIPHTGDHAWIDPTLIALKACLMQKGLPAPSKDCGYCQYRTKVAKIEKNKKDQV